MTTRYSLVLRRLLDRPFAFREMAADSKTACGHIHVMCALLGGARPRERRLLLVRFPKTGEENLRVKAQHHTDGTCRQAMPERVVTVPGLRDRRNFFRAGRTKRTSQLGGAMLSCRGCPFRCPLTGDVPHDSAAPADLQPFAGPVFPICPHDSSCDGWQRPHPRGEDLTNVGVLLYYRQAYLPCVGHNVSNPYR